MREVTVAPVAGIAIVHQLSDHIVLDRRDAVPWPGTSVTEPPLVIRHERGDARPPGMRRTLAVPPWCEFQLDGRGEPASLFHAIFGEVDRLLCCEVPGRAYVVRYAEQPREPVVALQSELAAFSFAIAARGSGLIAHACAFATCHGEGVLCPGVSGTGKTTLARLIARQGDGPAMLTDDRAVVTLGEGGLSVWGSPWPGAARIAGSGPARLTTVMFIRHGAKMALRDIRPSDAFRRIVNTVSMPLWEPARCGRALEIIDAIVTTARLVEATYPPTAAAADWLIGALDVRAEAVCR